MVYMLSLVLAFVLNIVGFAMRNYADLNVTESTPLISAFFISLSTAMFLNNLVLYPRNFRPIGKIAKCIYEFLLCGLIIEIVVSSVWCGIESQITAVLPTLGDTILDVSQRFLSDWNRFNGSLCMLNMVLHDEETLKLAGILVSALVFLVTLHLARIVDFMVLIRCGPKVFVMDFKDNLIQQKNELIAGICSSPCAPSRATSRNTPGIRKRSRSRR